MAYEPKTRNRNSAVDDVIQYVLYLIKEEKLPAGTKLPPENEICAKLNISRGPVREAMKIMQASGLIDIRQGNGTFIAGEQAEPLVNPLLLSLYKDPWDIDDLMELRGMLDILVYYMIIQNDDIETIERCTQLNKKITDGVEQGKDNSILHEYDIDYHRTLALSIKNPLFTRIYSFAYELYESIVTKRFQSFEGTSMFKHDFHNQVLHALKEHDLEKAVEALRNNKKHADVFFDQLRNMEVKK